MRGDVKWYFRFKHTRRLFAGLDATFRKQHFISYNTEVGYGERYFPVKELEAQKTSFGLALTFGQEFRMKPRLLFEFKIGAGLRYITMNHNFIPREPVNPGPEFFSISVPNIEDEVGNGAFAVYIPFALSFRYLLN